ncbi:MAG: hypothetical protein ABF633_02875 [Clostridium sp.]|uniref:hypothetical protein n=1 Tax=Clostridium sp. TaxID=1506 RepID=UPI0039EB0048
MFKISSPNKDYTGVSASVAFSNGVGLTGRKELIPWFKDHKYEVEEIKDDVKSVDDMTVDELKAYAEGKGIELTGLTKKDDILKKIKDSTPDPEGK